MKKEKYVYNPQTLQYEKVRIPLKKRIGNLFGISSAIILSSFVLSVVAYSFFPTPNEQALKRELSQMQYHYRDITEKYDELHFKVNELQDKDANIHKVVFGVEPLDASVWNGGTGGVEKFTDIIKYQGSGDVIKSTLEKVEMLERKMTLQENSLEEIEQLTKEREEKLASIPSIKPIYEKALKRKIRYLSGFGYRIHPIHKVRKFHAGIDFTCPAGTEIQATGNGVIKKVKTLKRGYGKHVVIDHGHGYRTLYGHLSEINVKVGQKVKKGEIIGLVGSTGTSTAPHLHYEVHINGKPVNPIDYCLDGLTPEEYLDLVTKARQENISFD